MNFFQGSQSLMKRNEQDHYKRVILHLDLDCFYAQVEHNRLKIPLTIPLAVQQWNGLIAVNYAAREAGIKRHMSVAEALLKCPQMRLVHVPTYSVTSITSHSQEEIVALPKYSDEMPAFRGDGTRLPPNAPDPASNKACLEPYRQASMAIFRLIRDWCTNLGDGVALLEKGGLDEAFLDISEEIEQQLIDEFDQKYTMLRDELADLESEELEIEALENLALYDISWIEQQLNFTGLGESAIFASEQNKQNDREVTDDIFPISPPPPIGEKMRMALGKLRIWKGAQIAKNLRSRLRSELNFIASIGIGPNKMLAKLVSALYKPDKQTRIEPEAIVAFMHRVPFEKIRMMGGKMGKSVLKSSTETDDQQQDNEDEDDNSEDEGNEQEGGYLTDAHKQVMAADLWPLSLSQLADRVGDRQTAYWIHQLIRGIDTSPVTPRSLTKSFMSAKSFRPSVRDWPELHDWVVVLVGELWSRISEEKEGSARWPSTITIHFKSFSKTTPTTTTGRNANWSNTGATTKSCEFPFSASIPSQATRAHFLSAVFKLLTSIQSSGTIFPMSRLAVSVANFKGMDADGKARATRVDQFFKKQLESSHNVSEISAGLDRFFPETVKINSVPDANQPVVKIQAKKSVLEMLQATAKPDSAKVNEPILYKSEPPTKRSKPSKPGILKYFTNSKFPSDSQTFNCPEKPCKFTCSNAKEKDIQEHLDYHVALKLSRELI